jgi:hypothetical protein
MQYYIRALESVDAGLGNFTKTKAFGAIVRFL